MIKAAVTCHLKASTALALALLTSAPAFAQSDPVQQEDQPTDIVVTGIRQSLAESISRKREANQIVDTITAEDIGKLPDENIAESIQRITGVQITRDRGEGLGVNIRGLSAQTTINGRVGLGSRTDGIAGRDFDFRNLAADFFQTIEVFKSPLASQPEGALGGTVNLITRKPLDLDDRVLSVAAEAQYGDGKRKVDPRLSVFAADQFFENTLGVSLSASISRRRLRSDFFQSLGGYQSSNVGFNTGFDFNRDGVSNDVLRPVDLRIRTANDTRTRYGADGTVQWKPSDSFELRLDGNYSRLENIIRNQFFRTLSNNPTQFVPGSLRIGSDGTLLGGTYNNQAVEVDGRYEPEPIDIYTVGANAKYTKGPLTIVGDASFTNTKRKLLSQFLRFQAITPATVRFDFAGLDRPPSILLTTAAGQPFDLTTPGLYIPNLVQDRIISTDARETSTRLDLTYEVNAGPLESVQFGGRATWRDIEQRTRTSANQATNTRNPAFYDQTTGRRFTIADQPLASFVGTFPFRNGVFPGVEGSFPRSWLVGTYDEGDPDVGSTDFLSRLNVRSFGGLINSNQEQSDLAEDTIAGYAATNWKGDLGSVGFRANAGIRYVRTKLTSAGLVTVAGVVSPISIDNSYDDWLPAANISFDLTDKLILRFAGAKVIERPDLTQLATGFAINISSGVASSGNPDLDPFRADQFDVSLEYYLSRDGLISVAAFKKNVSNFVSNLTSTGPIPGVVRLDGGTDFLITRPVNGGGGTIKGFEVGLQQPFTFLPAALRGFGMVANYTFSDSRTDSGQPIPRLSKHSVNLIGYYERDGFSARAAYSWRDRFALTGEGGNSVSAIGLFEYVDAAGYLDASASYDISKSVTVVLEGANLLNTPTVRYSGSESRLRDFITNERRFSVGVRAKF